MDSRVREALRRVCDHQGHMLADDGTIYNVYGIAIGKLKGGQVEEKRIVIHVDLLEQEHLGAAQLGFTANRDAGHELGPAIFDEELPGAEVLQSLKGPAHALPGGVGQC